MGYQPGNASFLLETYGAKYMKSGMTLLELGPGKSVRRSLVRKLAELRGLKYYFTDIRNDMDNHPGFIRMMGPFEIETPDNRFDVAVAFQMLHNVRKPWLWFPEVAHVVRPGGHVIVVDSVNEDLNRHPADCGRYFRDGMADLFDEAGLDVVASVMRAVDGRIIKRGKFGLASQVNLLTVGRKP